MLIANARRDRPALVAPMVAALGHEVMGVMERRVMDTSPPTVEYELTELGRPILRAVDVGQRLKERRAQPAGAAA